MEFPKELELFEKEFVENIVRLYSEKDRAHDFSHIVRILQNLRKFEKIEDRKMMYLAALVHGVQGKQETKLLLERYFGKGDAKEALILSKRAKSNPQSLNEKILHDVELLDAFGAVGIARAYTKGGYEHRTFEETTRILEQNAKRRFLTKTGRELAKDRIAFLSEFFRRLKTEM